MCSFHPAIWNRVNGRWLSQAILDKLAGTECERYDMTPEPDMTEQPARLGWFADCG